MRGGVGGGQAGDFGGQLVVDGVDADDDSEQEAAHVGERDPAHVAVRAVEVIGRVGELVVEALYVDLLEGGHLGSFPFAVDVFSITFRGLESKPPRTPGESGDGRGEDAGLGIPCVDVQADALPGQRGVQRLQLEPVAFAIHRHRLPASSEKSFSLHVDEAENFASFTSTHLPSNGLW